MVDDKVRTKLNTIQWGVTTIKRVLLVDNEVRMAKEVKTLLEGEGYEVQLAENGKTALEAFHEMPPDLVLSDIALRHMNGFDLCKKIKSDPATEQIPVILITGLTRPDDKIRGIEAGANDFIGKPYDPAELKTRVRSALRLKQLRAQLENIDEIIVAFARAVEARDPYTRGHSERVGQYAMKLADTMGLDAMHQEMFFRGALLHDIGKIGISDAILLKTGQLTKEEYAEIKKHPEIGVKICAPLKSSRPLVNIIAYHHERMDGKGYPYGLMGQEIPVEARIIAIADTFDALTSARPYRKAMSVIDACKILDEGLEVHFDEDLLPVFMEIALRGDLKDILIQARYPWTPTELDLELPDKLMQDLDFLA